MCVLKEVAHYMAFREASGEESSEPNSSFRDMSLMIGSYFKFLLSPSSSTGCAQSSYYMDIWRTLKIFHLTVINYLFNFYCKQITKVQKAKRKKS